jgi:hypothetical protein
MAEQLCLLSASQVKGMLEIWSVNFFSSSRSKPQTTLGARLISALPISTALANRSAKLRAKLPLCGYARTSMLPPWMRSQFVRGRTATVNEQHVIGRG